MTRTRCPLRLALLSALVGIFSCQIAVAQVGSSFAELDAALREQGELLAKATIQSTGCALPVWQAGVPARVYLVPEFAAEYGFVAGDYLVSVNGRRLPDDHEARIAQMSAIPADATVKVRVYRSGFYEEFSAKCQSAAEFAGAYDKLAEALLNLDGAGCTATIVDIVERAGDAITAELAETWLGCQSLTFPGDVQANGVQYLWNWSRMKIEESKYFPSEFAYARATVESYNAEFLRIGADDMYEELRLALADAQSFVDNDPSPPSFE